MGRTWTGRLSRVELSLTTYLTVFVFSTWAATRAPRDLALVPESGKAPLLSVAIRKVEDSIQVASYAAEASVIGSGHHSKPFFIVI